MNFTLIKLPTIEAWIKVRETYLLYIIHYSSRVNCSHLVSGKRGRQPMEGPPISKPPYIISETIRRPLQFPPMDNVISY